MTEIDATNHAREVERKLDDMEAAEFSAESNLNPKINNKTSEPRTSTPIPSTSTRQCQKSFPITSRWERDPDDNFISRPITNQAEICVEWTQTTPEMATPPDGAVKTSLPKRSKETKLIYPAVEGHLTSLRWEPAMNFHKNHQSLYKLRSVRSDQVVRTNRLILK